MNNNPNYRSCNSYDHNDATTCNCCVTGLAHIISSRFCCGDTIGITFFVDEGAGIFTGRFRSLENYVLEIEDLLVPGTTSFVPLCDIGSIEKGLPLQEQPLQISKKKE
ncbi:hypothetical protein GLW00_13160 [Halobacillus litoralis]|uniref:Uncharacterized protein n=1 Tax=Halobacillus litoralis TaxID=45668 RepID=A0A845FD84_9BACI|nr:MULTISPECIES: hypothetical protein [Halobacillus]MEC3884780.1 hypothetical protein [Halobacillus sp. HZG1]MYL71809.1 hypothetical protein [Halobacillus litoralis]